jgi:thiosulfate/3-mercaptopyruvate sulfurtransferase
VDPDRPASGPEAGDRPGPLVSAAWLLEHVRDRDLRLIHVSPNRRIYNKRHLPGAVYGDLHRDLARRGTDPATGDAPREWLLPARTDVDAVLRRWGVGESREGVIRRVVFYDDVGQNRQAIRGYWLLRLHRYPADRVHVLDGGIVAWCAAGGSATADTRPPAMPTRPARLGERDDSLIATADEVNAWSAEASVPGGPTRLLDVRSADEFVGFDGRDARRAGRIPGARNRAFSDFLRPDGTLRPVPEIVGLLRGTGVDPAEVRATYCQGGVRAALAWFALHELAGYDEVRSYAGSWEEWGNRDDLPIESDVTR